MRSLHISGSVGPKIVNVCGFIKGFFLQYGGYQPIPLNERGQRVSQALGLALVRWQGCDRGIKAIGLRWATLAGELLPLSQEIAEQERERAEKAESQLNSCALELLREGMSVERVARLTGLSEERVRDLSDRIAGDEG